MPIIRFMPMAAEAEVAVGTTVLAASRQAGLAIEAPCGGNGACGRCRVQVIAGQVDPVDPGPLTETQTKAGWVLACRARVGEQKAVITLAPQQHEQLHILGQRTAVEQASERPLPRDMACAPLTRQVAVEVPAPLPEQGLSDLQRLQQAWQDMGRTELAVTPQALCALPQALRTDDGRLLCSVHEQDKQSLLLRIQPQKGASPDYGLAIDLGTTSLAVQLVHLVDAEVIETATGANAQIACGDDVISRINYARKPAQRQELRNLVQSALTVLIDGLYDGLKISRDQVTCAVIAGNPTMLHLLLGVPPEYLRLEPYCPAFHDVQGVNGQALGLPLHPAAVIRISPSVASYVGGDITSGLLCTELVNGPDELSLFIDIGTNGEMVLGNREFLLCCACSAGPAFEGGGIADGMRAAPGAIDRVRIIPETGMPEIHTIGDQPARGICGSGMISLVAELFQSGWLDASGKLNRDRPCDAIRVDRRTGFFCLATPTEAETEDPIEISEIEIESVLRAKAAIYSAAALLLEQVGLGFDALHTVYLAGGFGHFLNIEQAIQIGMLPDIPRDRFAYLGNASLEGAARLLLSSEYRDKQHELVPRLTHMDLSTTPDYMNQYTAALFLPHTEPSRFPSVQSPTAPPAPAETDRRPNAKQAAKRKAIAKAKQSLQDADLHEVCPLTGLGTPDQGQLKIRAFGNDLVLNIETLDLRRADTGEAAKADDHLLLLHLLKQNVPVKPTGKLISFRDFQAGDFYYSSFQQRTIKPLLQRFGNDLASLRKNLERFDTEPIDTGDIGVEIHGFGSLYLTLIYRAGDDEFPADAEVLFDSSVKRVFDAEDASVFASRICIGLL